jgi:hypothetical protein
MTYGLSGAYQRGCRPATARRARIPVGKHRWRTAFATTIGSRGDYGFKVHLNVMTATAPSSPDLGKTYTVAHSQCSGSTRHIRTISIKTSRDPNRLNDLVTKTERGLLLHQFPSLGYTGITTYPS